VPHASETREIICLSFTIYRQ